MSQVPELIERALAVAGSQAELARLLKVAPPNITVWKKEEKPLQFIKVGPVKGLFYCVSFLQQLLFLGQLFALTIPNARALPSACWPHLIPARWA